MKVIKFVSIVLATVLAIAGLIWFWNTFPEAAELAMLIFSSITTAGLVLYTIWVLLAALWEAL